MAGEAILYRMIKKKNKRTEIKILDNCKYVYIHPLPCNHIEHSNGDMIIRNSWSGCYTTFHDVRILEMTIQRYPNDTPILFFSVVFCVVFYLWHTGLGTLGMMGVGETLTIFFSRLDF